MFLCLTSVMPEKEASQLRQIYEKYAHFMYYVSLKYLGDVHLAQDCTQQSLIRLIKYLDRLENMNAKQTKSYIYQVVASTALNMKKAEQRYIPESDERLIYMVDNVFQENEVERAFFEAESREALRQAQQNLSVEEKILIAQRYGQGLDYSEIAEFFNISVQACRKRMQRAKAHLAELLRRQDEMKDDDAERGGYVKKEKKSQNHSPGGRRQSGPAQRLKGRRKEKAAREEVSGDDEKNGKK